MSKGIIKEKKPQKLSRWEVIKAWIAESIASIKRSLKDGGWKGSMLALSSATAAAIAPTVLTACVNEPDVKIETITDKEKVESLVSENFSVENAVKDEMQKQFGKLENFTFENGVAKAVVTKDGEKYNAEVAINVDANDFKVEKYNNAEVANDGSLHFYLDGKLTSEKVDGIVVEVGKDIYVVDPTDFYNEISMAVSDAILKKVETEKPDPEEPENPGDPTDPENPDPEEPENPGGEDKPDPDEPENPDPEEPENPENPTDPENPDPDEPENPGGEDKPDPDEPENPGGEDKPDPDEPESPTDPENPDPEEPENPDPEKPEEPGGGETVEIKYEEYQNFDEFVLDLEGENLDNFQTAVSEKLRSEFSAQNFLTIFGRNSNLDNTRTYQIGFNFDDAGNVASLEYVGLRNDTKIAAATISFVEPIKIEDTAKVTYLGDVEKIIENGELVGIKYNEQDAHTNVVVEKELRLNENQILIEESGETYKLIDFSTIVSQMNQENFAKVKGGFSHIGSGTLTEENQQYFDLCMQLAVNADAIGENSELAFVTVQGRSSSNDEWGTTYYFEIDAIDLQNNSKLHYVFVFDDDRTSNTSLKDAIERAIGRTEFRINGGLDTEVLSNSDIVFEFDALNNVVTYTTPQKESENQA